MPDITPFLWFDTEAEEAANFYVRLFPNSKITKVVRNTGAAGPAGSVLTISFDLDGKSFTALNGGPYFKFSEAVSFVVHCKSQEEVDRYWDGLLAGGQASQCGWLKDRYGVSWQIVPDALLELVGDPDPARAKRATDAMMKMVKLDIAELRRAADAG